MDKVECKKCGNTNQKQLHLHHLFPHKLGGLDIDGRIYLCELHHKELHYLIKFLNLDTKEKIIAFTYEWLDLIKNKKICYKCKSIYSNLFLYKIYNDKVILKCPICGYEEENKQELINFIQEELKRVGKEDDSISKI